MLDSCSNAGDQPSSAHWHEDNLGLRQLVHYFESNSSRRRDDMGMVIANKNNGNFLSTELHMNNKQKVTLPIYVGPAIFS